MERCGAFAYLFKLNCFDVIKSIKEDLIEKTILAIN